MHPGITVLGIFGQSSRCAPKKKIKQIIISSQWILANHQSSNHIQPLLPRQRYVEGQAFHSKVASWSRILDAVSPLWHVVVFLADGHDGAWLRRRRSVLWVPHIRWGYWMCNGSGLVIEIDIDPLFRILGRETRFKLHSYIPHDSNNWRVSMLRFQCFVFFLIATRWVSKRHTSPQEKLQVRPLHSEMLWLETRFATLFGLSLGQNLYRNISTKAPR